MTRDEEIKVINKKLSIFVRSLDDWEPCRDPSSCFFLLQHVAEDLEPAICWDEASGCWMIHMNGAQTGYVPKQDLALGICRAIVAAKRL